MKTSFYFVLWIGLYALIYAFGGQWMQNNAFFVALVAVWALSGILNGITENQRAYMVQRQTAAFFELVYENDFKRYLSIFRRRFLFDVATFVYFILAIIFLVMIRDSWIIIAIFAFIGYGSTRSMINSYKAYSHIKSSNRFELSEESLELYNQYKQGRDAGYKATEMYPPATWKDKLLRVFNFLFSILSILIGIFYIGLYIPGLFMHGVSLMGAAMFVAYGGLAFIYGINDLMSTIMGHRA